MNNEMLLPPKFVETKTYVKGICNYVDGSGLQALIAYNGYTFACHYNNMSKPAQFHLAAGPRQLGRAHKIAVSMVQRTFEKIIEANVTPELREMNRVLYGEE